MRLVAAASLLLLVAIPASGDDAKTAPTPLPAPRLIGPRLGPEKAKALSAFGGSSTTEKSVAAGLDWLARHVDDSGLWDADGFPAKCAPGGKPCDGIGKGQHGEDMPCPFDEAISAFATMAFLGAGHLPGAKDDPYGALVEKALNRLTNVGDTWGLPLATEALSEAEAMERKGRWREAANRMAGQLVAQRQKDGAWAYCAGFRPGSDMPYTALVVSALVAARDAGFETPADLASGVDAYMNSLEEKKGRLAYLVDGRNYGYTPTRTNAHSAVAIRELLQVGLAGARQRVHMALVSDESPQWAISVQEVTTKDGRKVMQYTGNLSLYEWYYGTLAKFQEGGASWSGWFGAVKTALCGHQQTAGCPRGSWDPLGQYERATGGRVFATALAVLMLEQPYRHRKLAP
jgi:hypothetical protein